MLVKFAHVRQLIFAGYSARRLRNSGKAYLALLDNLRARPDSNAGAGVARQSSIAPAASNAGRTQGFGLLLHQLPAFACVMIRARTGKLRTLT